MIIFDAKGEMLGRYVSFKRFHQSVVIKDKFLPASPQGYLIYVAFEKNESYEMHEDFSKVVIDVYSKKQVELELLDTAEGMKMINGQWKAMNGWFD